MNEDGVAAASGGFSFALGKKRAFFTQGGVAGALPRREGSGKAARLWSVGGDFPLLPSSPLHLHSSEKPSAPVV
jgi:hypothetical protein